MDLNKITKRNREVTLTQTIMTVEVPVSIETIKVNDNHTVAFAATTGKIVIVPEKGDSPTNMLEMTPEEFAAFVKILNAKVNDLGLGEKAPNAEPVKQKRTWSRKKKDVPSPVPAPDAASPEESQTPTLETAPSDAPQFVVETLRPVTKAVVPKTAWPKDDDDVFEQESFVDTLARDAYNDAQVADTFDIEAL